MKMVANFFTGWYDGGMCVICSAYLDGGKAEDIAAMHVPPRSGSWVIKLLRAHGTPRRCAGKQPKPCPGDPCPLELMYRNGLPLHVIEGAVRLNRGTLKRHLERTHQMVMRQVGKRGKDMAVRKKRKRKILRRRR